MKVVQISVLLAIAILPLSIGPSTMAFASYNCANACHGVVDIQGQYDGASSSFNLVHINGGTNGHANTEIWLVSPVPSGYNCPLNGTQSPTCWVEVGAKYGYNQCPNSECYFWDDMRPCQGCSNNYYQHVLGYPQSSDYGASVGVVVNRIDNTDFSVSAAPVNGGMMYATSTSNIMQPNDIEIGGELQGLSGASIPTTNFRYNQQRNKGNSNWQYITNNGSATVNNPFQAKWVTPPSSSISGGNWQVYCPC